MLPARPWALPRPSRGDHNAKSRALFARAERVLVDGVASPSRGTLNYTPGPIFMELGDGPEIIDVDGNRYLDLMLGYGSLIHGHVHPRLVDAAKTAVSEGALFATASEVEIEVAEQVREIVPSAELVRFANTGTEACMAALRIARGYTGRRKVLKFEGHYHGWYDAYSVSSNPAPISVLGHRNDPVAIPDTSGVTPGAVRDTVVVPWNDANLVEDALRRLPGQVAVIASEPVMANMGVIPPRPGYVAQLRELADRYGALLYLDETVTGFRVGPGSAQRRFEVQPDIVTFGKALGAGFPVAAIGGRADVMRVLSNGAVYHAGTQNANPALLKIVRESLRMLSDGASAFEQLDAIGDRLGAGLRAAAHETGHPALVQGVGSLLQILFLRDGYEGITEIADMRDFARYVDTAKFSKFAHRLFKRGVYISPAPTLNLVVSTVHSTEHVDRVILAAKEVLGEMASDQRSHRAARDSSHARRIKP
jgi:glutamate-1-semialdehyde 2,1-aminomutase